MDGDYAGACKAINDWVSERTNGRISGLMDPGDKPADKLLMMLVDAVHFKADWLHPFSPETTQAQPFYLLDASKVNVPTMSRIGEYRFLKTKELQAVELPYKGERFAMVIVMPAEGGFEEFAGMMDPQKLEGVVSGLEPGRLHLWLPSFEITSAPKVTEALQAMGMTTAFTAAADLTGIADPEPGWPPWLISGVRQKAFIKIDERGTEAAAASGVTSMPAGTTTTAGPPLELRIDHPFTYLIRDTRSGATLFIGEVVDPRAED
jgi:serpin B